MRAGLAARAAAGLIAGAGLVVLGGCQSASGPTAPGATVSAPTSSGATASGEGGSSLRNLLVYGSTTVPPAAPNLLDEAYCPPVDVLDGGAALRALGGSGQGSAEGSVRHQISLGKFARECTSRPDGSVLVKVGVEGRILLGAGGGSGGRFDVPLRVVVKRGETTVASRSRRIAATIPAGDTQGTFTAVEEGLVVPPAYAKDYEILVGLGGGGSEPAKRGRRRAGGQASAQDGL